MVAASKASASKGKSSARDAKLRHVRQPHEPAQGPGDLDIFRRQVDPYDPTAEAPRQEAGGAPKARSHIEGHVADPEVEGVGQLDRGLPPAHVEFVDAGEIVGGDVAVGMAEALQALADRLFERAMGIVTRHVLFRGAHGPAPPPRAGGHSLTLGGEREGSRSYRPRNPIAST